MGCSLCCCRRGAYCAGSRKHAKSSSRHAATMRVLLKIQSNGPACTRSRCCLRKSETAQLLPREMTCSKGCGASGSRGPRLGFCSAGIPTSRSSRVETNYEECMWGGKQPSITSVYEPEYSLVHWPCTAGVREGGFCRALPADKSAISTERSSRRPVSTLHRMNTLQNGHAAAAAAAAAAAGAGDASPGRVELIVVGVGGVEQRDRVAIPQQPTVAVANQNAVDIRAVGAEVVQIDALVFVRAADLAVLVTARTAGK
eukprot:scaffold38888_cov66-Phaeocystis_antarctica.AAC.5